MAIRQIQATVYVADTQAETIGVSIPGNSIIYCIDTQAQILNGSMAGFIPVEQAFYLAAAGGTISSIANYFGATSNVPLVSGGIYEIEFIMFFLKTTAGTVTWTLTNSTAPTSQNIVYEMSPITGVVVPPGTATELSGQILNDATAAKTIVTGTLSDAVNHYVRIKIFLKNSTGTSLKIQATCSAGTITPGIGSYWIAKKLPTTNAGTFAA